MAIQKMTLTENCNWKANITLKVAITTLPNFHDSYFQCLNVLSTLGGKYPNSEFFLVRIRRFKK